MDEQTETDTSIDGSGSAFFSRIRIQPFIHIQPFCKNVFFSLIKSLKILSMYILLFLYSSYNKKDPKLDPHYCESADLD